MWAGFPTCGRVSWGRLLLWGKQLLWGRLSSLRPAFQPALVPFTHCSPSPNRRPQVEQAARLAMPAVAPAERHNPERYGSPNAIRPARLRAPPQPAAPCGASRQACHAGGHAGRATRSAAVGEFDTPTAAKTGGVARTTPRSTSTRRPLWSKPPGLPCRRSRRQSHTLRSCRGVRYANRRQDCLRGPQDCALHFRAWPAGLRASPQAAPSFPTSVFSVSSVVCLSPCPPCPLWFAFSVSSVVCPRITNP